MDLTSLSSTLPAQSRKSRELQDDDFPATAVMAAFKQAALSVTTLYKSANTEIDRARKRGYQDALDDLLHLINSDRIHINSEVAKIREWGLSRRRKSGSDAKGGARHGDPVDESEDERGQPRAADSSSPIPMRESEPPVQSTQQQHTPSHPEPTSSPSSSPTPPSPPQTHQPLPREKSSSFTFRSNHPYPRHPPPPPKAQMPEDIELPDSTPDSPTSTEPSLHLNHTFSPSSQRSTSGGWKRRFPFDFFEIAALAEKEKQAYAGMDFPNNKRGRMT